MKFLSILLVAASVAKLSECTTLPRIYDRASGMNRPGFHALRRASMQKRGEEPRRVTMDKPEPEGTKQSCSPKPHRKVKAPYDNVWSGLTTKESVDLTEFLLNDPVLNLTKSKDAGAWDNTITTIELLQPNKTDVLAYTDGTAKAPTRYAHAVLSFRATEEAYVQNFIVGPLPVKKGITKAEPLDFPYNGVNGGKIRNYLVDGGLKYEFLTNLTASIEDITLDLFNITITGKEEDNGFMLGVDPIWRENGRTISWDHLWALGAGEWDVATVLPSGFHIKSDTTGRDPLKWKILGIYYNEIFYKSLDELKAAYASPDFVKMGQVKEGSWANTDPYDEDEDDEEPDGSDIFPPELFAPSGGRHKVDVEKKYVEWMGFSFFVGFGRDTGLRLFDIKFKGERIIYELGLEEALAHYAGSGPTHSGASFLDSFYGFGPWSLELLPGYDCPSYATFLNTTYYAAETTITHQNGLCIFEQDAGFPIYRHTSTITPTNRYATATKNTFLVLRTVATVGNYDYTFDYHFYLDGTISVEVRASGYIQSAHVSGNDEYGFQIQENLSGSVHDHVLNFKLDFDILGTKNSVRTTEFVETKVQRTWSDTPRTTFKIKKDWLTSEDDGKINWDYNGQKSYTIVNKDHKNRHGEYRGYRVVPRGVAHTTLSDSSNLKQTAEWRHHHLYITRRHETERHSASPWNPLDADNPIQNFSHFFNSESLDQEDLVVWFNLGMHHMPNSNDLPNTAMTTAHSAIWIEPINFHDGNPAKKARQKVRVNYEAGRVLAVETFGAKQPVCGKVSVKRPDLSGFRGDVAVQKFAYDPRNWYYKTHVISE